MVFSFHPFHSSIILRKIIIILFFFLSELVCFFKKETLDERDSFIFSFNTYLLSVICQPIFQALKVQNRTKETRILCPHGTHTVLGRIPCKFRLRNRIPTGAPTSIESKYPHDLLLYFTCFCWLLASSSYLSPLTIFIKNQAHLTSQSNFHLGQIYATILRPGNFKLFVDSISSGPTITAMSLSSPSFAITVENWDLNYENQDSHHLPCSIK